MESPAFGLGVLLAIFGPLLLLPLAWLLQRLLRPLVRRLVAPATPPARVRLACWAVAVVLLGVLLAASYFPGRAEFRRQCVAYATPQIEQRVTVDGFFRERLFPYETHRLFDYGFRFLETVDPQRPRQERLLRYRRGANGQPVAVEVAALDSRYGVRHRLVQLPHTISRTEKRVYDRVDGRHLARAAHLTFEGGPMHLLLGAYAIATCPDIRTAEGSRAFGIFYDLEAIVLGGRPVPDAG